MFESRINPVLQDLSDSVSQDSGRIAFHLSPKCEADMDKQHKTRVDTFESCNVNSLAEIDNSEI